MEARNREFVARQVVALAAKLSGGGGAGCADDTAACEDAAVARAAAHSEASTRVAAVAAEGVRQARQYDAEARLLAAVLDTAGLPLDSLSARGQVAVRLIAGVCSELGLTRARPAEAAAAWAQLQLRQSRAVVLQAKLKRLCNEVTADTRAARERLQQLQSTLARVRVQQAAAERRTRGERQQVAELDVKQAEYARTLDKCTRKLAANGVTQEIHHSTLVERAAALQALQARAAELQAQVESYHSLPASTLGAGMMLQQARERLAAAQERLEAGLADL